jgi:hypothetical protein
MDAEQRDEDRQFKKDVVAWAFHFVTDIGSMHSLLIGHLGANTGQLS